MSAVIVSRVFPTDRPDVVAGKALRGITIYRVDAVSAGPGEPSSNGRSDLRLLVCELFHNAGPIAAVERLFRDRLRR
jgi:hypothetical protein